MRCLVLALPLAACGPAPTDQRPRDEVEAQQRGDRGDGDRVRCARSGAATLEPVCVVERTERPGGLVLTLRHPDGGFRRLQVTRDGRGVVAADGAEPATVRILGADRIEVAIAGERYQLPATVKGR